jgi:hypothetical protein
MLYLASPYTHGDPRVREARFDAACRATAALVRAGHVVFSPVVHSHPLVRFGLPTDWEYWERCDREYLRHATELVVLKLDGWRESVGVQAEIDLALDMGLPTRFLEPMPHNARAETSL